MMTQSNSSVVQISLLSVSIRNCRNSDARVGHRRLDKSSARDRSSPENFAKGLPLLPARNCTHSGYLLDGKGAMHRYADCLVLF